MATGVIVEYRRRAAECRFQAEKTNGDDKARRLMLAARWQDFAVEAERQQKLHDEKRAEAVFQRPRGRPMIGDAQVSVLRKDANVPERPATTPPL